MISFKLAPLLAVEQNFAQWIEDESGLIGARIPRTAAGQDNFRGRLQTQLDQFAVSVHLDYQLAPYVVVTYAESDIDVSVEWVSV